MGMKQIAKKLGGNISKNSPAILTGIAVAGVFTTAVLAVRATPKALDLIDQELFERRGDDIYDGDQGQAHLSRLAQLSVRDIIKATWRCYIPACGVGIATAACIIGANSISSRRNAALASVYTLTETAFKEYQSKVTETIGKNKERKIHDDVAADRIKANPPSTSEVIFTGKGDVLCYESISGRYFKHNQEGIRQIKNNLNERMIKGDDYITLNELYFELGLPETKMGYNMAWHIDNGQMEFNFSSTLTPEGEPCLVLDYAALPNFTAI